MFTLKLHANALSVIIKNWKNPNINNSPLAGGWIDKLWCVQHHGYTSNALAKGKKPDRRWKGLWGDPDS